MSADIDTLKKTHDTMIETVELYREEMTRCHQMCEAYKSTCDHLNEQHSVIIKTLTIVQNLLEKNKTSEASREVDICLSKINQS